MSEQNTGVPGSKDRWAFPTTAASTGAYRAATSRRSVPQRVQRGPAAPANSLSAKYDPASLGRVAVVPVRR